MKIREHIPAFISDLKPHEATFETIDQLLSISWVARWKKDSFVDLPFLRFSLTRYTKGKDLLMAEFDGGRKWWVVGYINQPSPELRAALPEWTRP